MRGEPRSLAAPCAWQVLFSDDFDSSPLGLEFLPGGPGARKKRKRANGANGGQEDGANGRGRRKKGKR